ncbi:aldehyde dehydrogenase (NADP(+)) [Paenarthrobacter sp. NPDC090522]|uniref:aldehyde dehydrogenase (NADP(+)) n=1 Tax=Paenarthrobacter sp. NPDC090522 TaxID=3364383 RepID=UPI003805AE77
MPTIAGTNPYTGKRLEPIATESSDVDVDRIARGSRSTFGYLRKLGREGRARLLESIADAVDIGAEGLIKAADEETGIGTTRLAAELNRSTYQMRFFAEVLREGSYLEATIDTAGQSPMGPRPDLRRILQPIGPVAVFGSSNFPFAFSILGGDTASALAAGCPVVLKAHSSHPKTSELSHDVMVAAARNFGAPDGTIGIVFGQDAGSALVRHPLIQAVGFTGSLSGGTALLNVINSRPQPIPFYGELSSLNPLIVTPNAAMERGAEIGARLAASITTSAGQLCTKPGVAFVSEGPDGDALVRALAEELSAITVAPLLNQRIFEEYGSITSALDDLDGVQRITPRVAQAEKGFHVSPAVFSIKASKLGPEVVRECFGPSALIVRYSTLPELESALTTMLGSLTVTIHFGTGDENLTARLTELSVPFAGRILYNDYPTGVNVSWAQTHGGPWPSTNTLHTSVGSTAVRRFLRPVTFQDAPASLLPDELQDGPNTIPRRMNGRLTLPDGPTSR